MAISLSKGQNISLQKEDPNLKLIKIGLGWDARKTDGKDFDLDASVFCLNDARQCAKPEEDFVFYGMKKTYNDAIVHNGDNRTGQGDGDDESIDIDLSRIPENIKSMVFTITIHEAKERGQSFGQVQNAFIRLENKESGKELIRFDLSEDYSTETAMMMAEVYRHNGEWKMKAIGQGFEKGLEGLCNNFGIQVA